MLCHVAVTRSEALVARRRASAPVLPLGPGAIYAHLASLGIAGGDLGLVLGRAKRATIAWGHLDHALPALSATAAGASARTPFLPPTPDTIGCAARLLVRNATTRLFEACIAALPTKPGSLQDLAFAVGDARATLGGASGPFAPIREAAVVGARRCARFGAAGMCLMKTFRKAAAAVLRALLDVALPVRLAPVARLAALRPLGPKAHLARLLIGLRLWAAHGLTHGVHARLASKGGSLLDLARTVLLQATE
mmetsp:Transcript_98263/g.286528  ORF Transcript_98263/g.286528 Transcript_98263/m.286528 type:complete len:251 (+) Transcript_98263:2145-2897(+)